MSYLWRGRRHVGLVKDGAAAPFQEDGVGLRQLLAKGALVEAARQARAVHDLAEVKFLPVIPDPAKVLCVGLNYEGHRVETNSPRSDHPQIFCRFADTLVGHDQAMTKPACSEAFDYEGELAVVIGRHARRVKEEDALDCVAGYTCFNDGSVRDWQKHTSQFIPGKNFPGTGALGPWLVTPDEVGDPSALEITTRLNGEVVQQDTTANMLFSVARIISYCSQFTSLSPGDVIATGTPSGVGYRRAPPVFMRAGDVAEVEISRIGVLRSHIEEEAARDNDYAG